MLALLIRWNMQELVSQGNASINEFGFCMLNEQLKFCAVLAQLYLSVSKIKFPNVIDQISTFNSNRAERALIVYT